jgi:hypothetical protein
MGTNDENFELLHLALGDLTPEAEAELRRRIAGVPEAQAELAALEDALALASRIPVDPPPPTMDQAIMAAARRHAVANGSGEAEPIGLWRRVVRFLRHTVNGPQVAMATITLLVVAVGLWFVPTARRDGDDATAMRISDATHPPPDEGATVLSPAAERESPEQAAAGGVIKIELEEAKGDLTSKSAARRSRQAEKALPPEPAPAPTTSAAKRSASAPAAGASIKDEAVANELDGMAHQAARAPAPARMAPESSAVPRGEAHEQEAAADVGAYEGPVASSGSTATRTVAASADSTASRITEAERLFQARDFAAAAALAREIIQSPRTAERGSLVVAYDVAARSERARNRCAAAIPLYEHVVKTTYARAAEARNELADCKVRVAK